MNRSRSKMRADESERVMLGRSLSRQRARPPTRLSPATVAVCQHHIPNGTAGRARSTGLDRAGAGHPGRDLRSCLKSQPRSRSHPLRSHASATGPLPTTMRKPVMTVVRGRPRSSSSATKARSSGTSAERVGLAPEPQAACATPSGARVIALSPSSTSYTSMRTLLTAGSSASAAAIQLDAAAACCAVSSR